MPNTVQVQVKCAHPRFRTHVQRSYSSGYPCQPLCKYKYSVHAHVHAPMRNKCIAQAAHAKQCTRSRTGFMSTHAHSRTIGASLKRPMPNAVHIHVRDARSTPLACNGYTAQDGTRRAMCKHTRTHFCAESTQLGPYMPNAVHAHTHVLTTTGIWLGLHLPTAVHTHVQRCTTRAAHAERRTVRTPA